MAEQEEFRQSCYELGYFFTEDECAVVVSKFGSGGQVSEEQVR